MRGNEIKYDLSGPPVPAASLFFAGIIYSGDNEQLQLTLTSVVRQKKDDINVAIHIFCAENKLPSIPINNNIVLITYLNKQHFFHRLITAIQNCNAAYCSILLNGEQLFDNAYTSANNIFEKYNTVNWLTGIQTLKTKTGFNITLGSTAMRRWSFKMYEHNLYKKCCLFK